MNFNQAFNEYLRANDMLYVDVSGGEVDTMKSLTKLIARNESRVKVIDRFFGGKV